MGYYKMRAMECCENRYSYDLSLMYDENDDIKPSFPFVYEIWSKLQNCEHTKPDSLIQEFFNDLFPELQDSEQIWIMVSKGTYVYNEAFWNRKQALKGLCMLKDESVNLFFSPAIFKGWRKDKNVSRINTIYIDIDDIEGVDFSCMDEGLLKHYLMTTYSLTEEMLPNWVVCSGHGLHLYYLVDTLNLRNGADIEARLKYTDYLITYFHADIACRNKSRILRFPNSRNVKNPEDIKTTRLFHLNRSNNKDISRLNYFAFTQQEIVEYAEECKSRRAEKRKQTMIANGTWKTSANKNPAPKKKLPKANKETTTKAEPLPEIRKSSHPELEVNLTPLETKARYRRILRDLHNYAARRKGVPCGYRAIFTHILAVYLKRMNLSEEVAVYYAERYLDADFMNEAQSIISSVYQTTTEYMYRNEHIAELLNFDEEDLKIAFSAYTEEQKKTSRKKSTAAYDNKRYEKARAKRQEKQQNLYGYIESHPEMSSRKLAEHFGCSIRKVQYIRAKIKLGDK